MRIGTLVRFIDAVWGWRMADGGWQVINGVIRKLQQGSLGAAISCVGMGTWARWAGSIRQPKLVRFEKLPPRYSAFESCINNTLVIWLAPKIFTGALPLNLYGLVSDESFTNVVKKPS